jgi:nucleoid-associated protein YgaU
VLTTRPPAALEESHLPGLQRHLQRNWDATGNVNTSYFNNASGLVLKRERTQGVSRIGSHFYYYADGRRVGDVSDDPSDNPRVSYAEALATKNAQAPERRTLYRSFRPVTSADFDQSYEPINESYPGAVPGSYTVRGGETLQGIAQALWGDRSLWYLIAEANGLSGNEALASGRVLVIPNKVTNLGCLAGKGDEPDPVTES